MHPLRDKVRELRKKGFSYNEINKELGVSKSSICYMVRDIKLSLDQKERLNRKQKENVVSLHTWREENIKAKTEPYKRENFKERKCVDCEQLLPPESFPWKWKERNIRVYRCHSCYNIYHKKYRKQNTTSTRGHVRKYSGKKRSYVRSIKEAAVCMDCGEKYPYYVYDFHHRDPEDKLFNINGNVSFGLEIIKEEIAKCDILCSNCHRIRTFGGSCER